MLRSQFYKLWDTLSFFIIVLPLVEEIIPKTPPSLHNWSTVKAMRLAPTDSLCTCSALLICCVFSLLQIFNLWKHKYQLLNLGSQRSLQFLEVTDIWPVFGNTRILSIHSAPRILSPSGAVLVHNPILALEPDQYRSQPSHETSDCMDRLKCQPTAQAGFL